MKVLRKKRIEVGYTQKEVARLLGVKQNTVCQWEGGHRTPSLEALKKYSKLFDCKVDDLLGEGGND